VDWLRRIFGRNSAELVPDADHEPPTDAPAAGTAPSDKQLLKLARRVLALAGDSWDFHGNTAGSDELAAIRALERADAARMAVLLSRQLHGVKPGQLQWQAPARKKLTTTSKLLGLILRKALPFDEAALVDVVGGVLPGRSYYVAHLSGVVAAVERATVTPPVQAALVAMLGRLPPEGDEAYRKARRRAAQLAGHADADPLPRGLPWSEAARATREGADADAWNALLTHATTATASKPSKKWLKQANAHLDAVGFEAFRAAAVAWFAAFDRPNPAVEEPANPWLPGPWTVPDEHLAILKGLAWFGGLQADPELARALTRLCIASHRKIPGHGPRALRVGNAAVWALGNQPGLDAVGQLAVLRVRLRGRAAAKVVAKAFAAAAEREGVPADEIEEMAVPAYGLTTVGRREEVLGDFTAELVVDGKGKAALTWRKPDGKHQKSVPAAVKRDFADELKELKAAAKDIDKMLSAQARRLDGLLLRREPWAFDVWRERYLDHPLVGTLARRLIWTVGGVPALWRDDALRDLDGAAVEPGDVQPWHPLGVDPDAVLAWRDRLASLELVQPFKQAWREVYVLTPAEEATGTYSNRFAAHLLRQHAMSALAATRGWRYALHLMVDDAFGPASKELPAWGLRAEFWVDGAGDEYEVDTNETGVYLYMATDSVRFYPLDQASGAWSHYGSRERGAAESLPLTDIPPVVLSEVLRDVDLFVGVCSVGNDPQWQDGGRRPDWITYWTGYAFGDLSETAKTRAAALANLVPKLAIRDQARVEGRWVYVRGTRHEYRIHIGSGNIQILPHHKYLCIVPGGKPASTGKVFLPFEGDRILSIVLSKAMLLARDDRITDPTILAQL
jgi:hypothetical protein